VEKQETSLYYPVHQVHSLFTATFLRSLEALYMNMTISGQASALAEVGFEYVTGEYNDGGKIFRKRK